MAKFDLVYLYGLVGSKGPIEGIEFDIIIY